MYMFLRLKHMNMSPSLSLLGIYELPGNRDEKCEEHALIAVAKGRTLDGVDFIVVQNFWGMKYDNHGYCRISLSDTRDYDILWPMW